MVLSVFAFISVSSPYHIVWIFIKNRLADFLRNIETCHLHHFDTNPKFLPLLLFEPRH